jgi:hypothetical protein
LYPRNDPLRTLSHEEAEYGEREREREREREKRERKKSK